MANLSFSGVRTGYTFQHQDKNDTWCILLIESDSMVIEKAAEKSLWFACVCLWICIYLDLYTFRAHISQQLKAWSNWFVSFILADWRISSSLCHTRNLTHICNSGPDNDFKRGLNLRPYSAQYWGIYSSIRIYYSVITTAQNTLLPSICLLLCNPCLQILRRNFRS